MHGGWLYITGCMLTMLGALLAAITAVEMRKTEKHYTYRGGPITLSCWSDETATVVSCLFYITGNIVFILGSVLFFPRILEAGGPIIRMTAVLLFLLGSLLFTTGALIDFLVLVRSSSASLCNGPVPVVRAKSESAVELYAVRALRDGNAALTTTTCCTACAKNQDCNGASYVKQISGSCELRPQHLFVKSSAQGLASDSTMLTTTTDQPSSAVHDCICGRGTTALPASKQRKVYQAMRDEDEEETISMQSIASDAAKGEANATLLANADALRWRHASTELSLVESPREMEDLRLVSNC